MPRIARETKQKTENRSECIKKGMIGLSEVCELDLSAEVARLRSEVTLLRLERDQDLEEIRVACAMAEFLLWTCRSVDHQEVAGYGPAGSDEQLGSVEVAVGGVAQGQKPLHGDALN